MVASTPTSPETDFSSRAFRDNLAFQTRDLDEARSRVADIYTAHELDYRRRQSALDARFYHLPLRCASINLLAYGSDMVVTPGELENFFLVQTPLRGGGDVMCGGQHIITSARRSSVLSPNLPSRMVWEADCWQAQVRLDRALVERCAADLLEKPLTRPLEFQLGMDMSSDLGQSWWSTVQFVAEEIPRLQSLPDAGPMLKQLELLLANSLLHIQRHNYSDELARQQPRLAPRHVKRAEEYMRQHSHEALRIHDLVAASGVSERALYQGFKQFRGVSPMRVLKSIRLEKVREALQQAPLDDCVTRIASDQGFTQLGRFAVEYRERFGESPSDTLRRGGAR